MESGALTCWRRDRRHHVHRLLTACRAIERTDVLPGPEADGLWRAATVLLTVEFAAFARDLHDRAVERFAFLAAPDNPKLVTVLNDLALRDRRLDRVTAQPADLGHDFGGLGLYLWSRLGERYPSRWIDWHDALLALDDARAAAMGAPTPLALPAPRGEELARWANSLEEITKALDQVVVDHLADLFGTDQPWHLPVAARFPV
jgi:hypothetical protein